MARRRLGSCRPRSALVGTSAVVLCLPAVRGVGFDPWSSGRTTTQPPPQAYVCDPRPVARNGAPGATVKPLMRRDSITEKELLPGRHHLGNHWQAVYEEYQYEEPRRRNLPDWFDWNADRKLPRNASLAATLATAKGLDPNLWSFPIGNYSYLDTTEDWRSAIDAVHCGGRGCQFMSVHFSKGRNLTKDVDHFTKWIGRRGKGLEEAKCPEGRVASGIQCHGDDCSSLRLACGVPQRSWAISDRETVEMGNFTSECEEVEEDKQVRQDSFSTCGGTEISSGGFENYVLYGVKCTTPACSHKRLLCRRIKEKVVDCEWGAWSLFSPCTTSCGSGWMVRVRRPSVNGTWDGQKCGGPWKEREQCNAFECE